MAVTLKKFMGVAYNQRATAQIKNIMGGEHPTVKKIMGAEGEGGYAEGAVVEFNAATLRTISMYKPSTQWTKGKSIQMGNRGGTVTVSCYANNGTSWTKSYQVRRNDTEVLFELNPWLAGNGTFTRTGVILEPYDTVEVWVAWYNLNPEPQNCNWDEFKILVEGASLYADLPTEEF